MPWSIFRVLKKALDEADIEGLRALGCPEDEYDAEASLIESKIARLTNFGKQEISIREMQIVVEEVWNSQFGPMSEEDLLRRRPAFRAVAEKILPKVDHA